MLIGICNTYAQLNIANDAIKQQLEQKNNLQVLGRTDIIDNKFIPFDSLVFQAPNREFDFHDNVVGLKTYLYDAPYNDNGFSSSRILYDLQLCINKIDSTVAFKPVKLECYYDIIGIIRFDKQAKYHQQEIERLRLVPNEILQGREQNMLSYIFNQWDKYFISTDEYIKTYIVDGNKNRNGAIIYLLKNEDNDIYYIAAYPWGDYYRYPSVRSFEGYRRIDLPYYERFLELKGKDVAIYYIGEDDKYIKDYITEQPLENKLNKDYMKIDYGEDPLLKYFKNPIYVKCSDIFISEDRVICGLFEQEGAKFSLGLHPNGKPEWYGDLTSTDLTYFSCYDGRGRCGIMYTKNVIDTYKANQTEAKQARVAAKKELLRKQSAEKAQRESDIIAKYGSTFGKAIVKGDIMLGMTQEMCQDAWGYPHDKFNTTTSLGTVSIWMYNYKTYLHFKNGKLIEIEN